MTQSRELRRLVQRLVRSLGVLSSSSTPCGKDLPVSEAHALMLLLEHGQLPQSAFEPLLGIDKSNVSRLRDRLMRAGRIQTETSQRQGRAVTILKLTARGQKLAEELEKASGLRFASLLKKIPRGRRARILGALDELNAALIQLRPGGEDVAEPPREPDDPGLTDRQRQVLVLAAQGLSNADIGKRLSIGKRTVESHRAVISRRLGLKGPLAWFRFATENGLINERSRRR